MKDSSVMGKRERGIVRIGATALGCAFIAIALVASPVGATPLTGYSSGSFESLVYGDGTKTLLSQNESLASGYSTLLGADECYSIVNFDITPKTPVRCDVTDVEFHLFSEPPGMTVCQSEDKDGLMWAAPVIEGSYSCIPLTCFDSDGSLLPGCETRSHVKYDIFDGTGIFLNSAGSFTVTTTTTYDTPKDGTFESDTVGDITLIGGDPPNDLYIDSPAEGSAQSGIDLVRGWSCLGGQLEVQFSEADGTAIGEPFSLAHGTPRESAVEDICGDTNNGFAMQINWNILGTGQKTMTLLVNGEERATRNFSVVDPAM